MKEEFKNKVAVITGASMGMGLAAAKAFAAAGAHVALVDILDASAQAEELKAAGYKAEAFICDVADEKQVKETVEKIVAQFGSIDFAFNNAGIQAPPQELADVSNEIYDRVMDVNLKGIWNFMKYELQQMRRQGSGAIVNNSSLGGLVGLPERAVYHASKHGILGMTKSAALEYAPQGIRINAVCPGIIVTPMVEDMLVGQAEAMNAMIEQLPIKRLGRAEEIADVVLWLCSNASTYVIGQAIAVDGGYTVQ
ncbi:SDR family NAD(P)-dependent oxidoreductase [Flavobacterium aquicola]|uniref:NAD(P)-dependent dehydrogenase (Short-subunit alcohol dehydrogenase family) n=1 Tax=Flavobacterium aquicola TaxID=1682742 RepID=A0A3E0E1W5_9FLAO|nr:SDR family oxidoreductase [Flavobacterium aquicola]REG91630.1 NAD(P)-dependent dehydrogenase (short-subunit alcohol dehydrogenase family) [Flavobacterium aquicola]